MSNKSRYTINKNLCIENKGNSNYLCIYKENEIEYNDIKVNENKIHSIYENFNKIEYEYLKYWFYNKRNKIDLNKNNIIFECIDYLKNKDFYQMSKIDKVLLTIIYSELYRLRTI